MENLIKEISAFRNRHNMTRTDFGLKAVNDPAFVPRLENGRDCKWSTVERVREFMAEYDGKAAGFKVVA